MKKIGLTTLVLFVAFGLMLPVNLAFASDSQEQSAKELAVQWWQWIYSIPRTVNPVLDLDGKDCVVGQRGDVWFLGGNFADAPRVTRTCLVPEGKALFFPVLNAAFFDSPNACGQGSVSFSVKVMRAAIADFINAATTLAVTLDGQPFKNIDRFRSKVFEVALPEDNVGDSPDVSCAAGVYSPGVDDGYYARIEPLNPGPHELHIQAAVPSLKFAVDVTYHLTVVPVTLK